MTITIRQAAIAAATVALLLFAALGLWKWREAVLERERALRVAAEQSADLAGETTRIIEKTTNNERTIYRDVEDQADVIQSQPGADDPVPPDVLNAWRVAIDGLRGEPKAADDLRS